jgi:hypothetical protein
MGHTHPCRDVGTHPKLRTLGAEMLTPILNNISPDPMAACLSASARLKVQGLANGKVTKTNFLMALAFFTPFFKQ